MLGGADDVGEHHRREDAVGVVGAARAGDELLDLVKQRVGVAREVDVVVAGQLQVARARDVGGQVTAVADVDEAIAAAMDDQRRDLDRRQHCAHVERVDRLEDRRTIPGRTEWRSKCPHQRLKAGVLGQRRREHVQRRAGPPSVDPVLADGGDQRRGPALRIVGGLEPPRARPVEDQADAALGVGGGEQRRHRTALRGAEQDRALGADGVHHRQHVVHPLLERLRGRDGVRQPAAALVEHDQPAERGDPAQEVRGRRVLPVLLDVRQPLRHQDHVDVAFANDLVGDAQLAGSCESGLR